MRTKNNNGVLPCFVALICMLKSLHSADTAIDDSLNVNVGTTATLQCHSSILEDIDWKYQLTLTSEPKFVYATGHVFDIYQSRFTVNKTSPHDYQLTIHNVQYNDSGLYSCIEGSGLGKKHITQLNITDMPPIMEAETSMRLAVVLTLSIAILSVIIIMIVIIIVKRKRRNRRHRYA